VVSRSTSINTVHVPRATTIRTASDDDRKDILDLIRDAFSDETRDGQIEVDIAVDTWALGAVPDGLELAAVEDGVVVGHVLSGWGDLDGKEVVGVAPLAVAPARQGLGIGTALMMELLLRAEADALPLMVLLGHPAYYERFGFEPSGPLGISYRPVGADNPNFQVRRFQRYEPSYRGAFTYCWEMQGR
jgi:putative acetyltransferase